MTPDWRTLLYPLGFLAALCFGGRFLLQWLQSELQRKSLLHKSFWYLSIAGNFLLWLHCLIQLQIHVCLIQIGNGAIAWRNLNLMEPKSKQVRRRTVIAMMALGSLATILVFSMQGQIDWFRIPTLPGGSQAATVSPVWHLAGSLGITFFSLRFWVQWWYAEKGLSGQLNSSFWWISLCGAALSVIYFARIHDLVNLIGPLIGMIPYTRNLILLRKSNHETLQPS